MDDPRHWWRDVVPRDWRVFADRDDIARDKFTAILAALDELSTRGPMSTLSEILTHLRTVGYFDPLTEPELRKALDELAGDELCTTFRDYAAPLRSYQEMLGRQEGWALTPRGRYVVAAVRSAVVDAHRALQLPSRLLDSVERTIRRMLTHLVDDSGMLPADLDDARTRVEELQRVTADYYTALAHMVQSDVTDDVVFGDNRERVIEALRQFPREYERALRRVEAALMELEGAGYRRLVEEAVAHAGLLDARDQQHWIEERGRSSKLTLSYRTTQEILDQAAKVIRSGTYDDLDDGTDTLHGYHSLLHGPAPEYVACADWTDEIAQLAETLKQWRTEITQPDADGAVRDPSGTIAVCVADGEMASRVAADLETKYGVTTATLTKEGPQGGGEVHIGTMHRFKGLEYQKLAIIGASDGILPRTALIEKYATADPNRYERELKKSRSQLFVAATRARDALRISWHGKPSPFLPLSSNSRS